MSCTNIWKSLERHPSPLWHQDHRCGPLSILGVLPLHVTVVSSLEFREALPASLPQTGSLVTSWCPSVWSPGISVRECPLALFHSALAESICCANSWECWDARREHRRGLPVKTGGAKMSHKGGGMESFLLSEGRGRKLGAVPGLSLAGGVWPDIGPYG